MLELSRLLPMLVAAIAVGCVYPDLKMGTSSGGAGGSGGSGTEIVCAGSPVTPLCQNVITAAMTDSCSICVANQCCAQVSACFNDTECLTNGSGPLSAALVNCQNTCCSSLCNATGGQGGSSEGTGGTRSSGGAPGIGGVMASGGVYGTTGGTRTGGTTATGGRIALGGANGSGTGGNTSNLCNGLIPPTTTGSLTVTSGYVTIGTLHGYAWAWVGDNSNATTCITPTCNSSSCTPQFAETSLCVAGDVTADSSGKSTAGVVFNVNQPNTPGAAAGAITIANSITLTDVLSGTTGYLGNPSLRAYMDDASGNHYCVESGAWTSGKPIPITSFNTQCWKPTSSALYASATMPIIGIGLEVPSSTTVGRPFAFCLTNITVNICAPSPGGKSCANAGDLYCSGTVCCPSSTPYYCPATSFCYPTAEQAAADCGSMACSGCGSN